METIPEVSFTSQVLLEPEALLERDARTIAYSKLKTELDELKVSMGDRISIVVIEMLANERAELKNALAIEHTDFKNAIL